MPGNSKRRGAVRKSAKGNPPVGSGGRVRRGLEGKGPTPKAKDREGHVASRRSRPAAAPTRRSGGGRGTSSAEPRPRPPADRSRSSGPSSASEWVAGHNAAVEALRAGVPVTSIYVAEQPERDDRLRDVFAIAAKRGIPLLEVPRAQLDRLTGNAVHQGVALQVRAYAYAHPDDLVARAHDRAEVPLVVALDGVTDPRNLGAVVRSAAAFGAHGVVVPERRAAGMTAGAWKASAGMAAKLPVARATNLTRQLKAYQSAGLMVAGLAADASVDLGDLAVAEDPLVLVIGSEGKGLSRLVAETCDVLVRIPMSSGTESLNASVAAGVALYAIARSRATS